MNSSDIKLSVPPGTVVNGLKGQYKVNNIICISGRSVTMSCTDLSGKRWRLKVYNGQNAVTEEVQKTLLSLTINGILHPFDIGDYSGLRFAVYREIDGATSMDRYPVSVQTLIKKIIPQIAQMLEQFHLNGILLRDICPEHFLYKPDEEMVAYCGFSNAVLLKGNATATKAPGYGQHYSFIAPEVEKSGYSTSSDYFSLGITLLAILRGYNPIERISQEVFYEQLKKGVIPGIDIQHLRETSPSLYSSEDRVQYLILGLLLPNPMIRWGKGEIRCWCNNQMIPLVQNGNRVDYQFTEPYIIGNQKCWNTVMLAKGIAVQQNAWSEITVNQIPDFCLKQALKKSGELGRIQNDTGISLSGKVFHYIYTLDPSISGFWWNGVRYSDTTNLINSVKEGKLNLSELSTMLKDSVLSFFVKSRQSLGICETDLKEIEALEIYERSHPGKGAYRCLMLLSGDENRSFTVEGKSYSEMSQLISAYYTNGRRLREISASIILNDSFQAWLWVKGMETFGNEAANHALNHPEQGFFLLLSFCEHVISDNACKRKVRELYMRYGEFSPIIWLSFNVKCYRCTDDMHKVLYDTFLHANFNSSEDLKTISHKANSMVSDYQLFVSRTATNPFLVENEKPDKDLFGYFPLYETGYFCCKWNNGLEVCPAFLRSIGEQADNSVIKFWLQKAANEEQQRLKNLNNTISPLDTSTSKSEKHYLDSCNRNIGFSIYMLVLCIVLFVLSLMRFPKIGVFAFIAAVPLPVLSIIWYSNGKTQAEAWAQNNAEIRKRHSIIISQIDNLHNRRAAIEQNIINGKNANCNIGDAITSTDLPDIKDPQTLYLESKLNLLAFISTYGFVMLATLAASRYFQSFASACLYALVYGIAIPVLIQRYRIMRNCVEWSIITTVMVAASIAGGVIFGSTVFVTLIWIPIIIVIGFTVCCLLAIFK